jgi:hypothetical protein
VPKNVMQVLDRRLGLMECSICGRRHFAGPGDDRHYVRGAWRCQNGCQRKLKPQPISARVVPLQPI